MTDNSIPRHQQIADQLREEIADEHFEPGDKLPSEKRLCEYFDVSRITVRQALTALENEGLIFKKQGIGAFVSKEKPLQTLVHLTDFAEDMRRAGFTTSSELIRFEKTEPVMDVNLTLALPPDHPLIRIDRVRMADGKPVAFDITWMPPSYGQLLMDEDLKTKTIYEILEDQYSIPILAGMYKFTACPADAYVAQHLNVNVNTALLRIDRCSKTTGGKKVYFQRRYNNPRHISYDIELVRTDESRSSREGLPLKQFTPRFEM